MYVQSVHSNRQHAPSHGLLTHLDRFVIELRNSSVTSTLTITESTVMTLHRLLGWSRIQDVTCYTTFTNLLPLRHAICSTWREELLSPSPTQGVSNQSARNWRKYQNAQAKFSEFPSGHRSKFYNQPISDLYFSPKISQAFLQQ